jgi:hypothetical protein
VPQETQPLIDFLFAGTGLLVATGAGAAGGLAEMGAGCATGLADFEPPAVAAGLVAAAVVVAAAVDAAAGVVPPAISVVIAEPTALMLGSVVFVVLATPERSTVPVTVALAAAAGAALCAVAALSPALPCIEPQAASGNARAIAAADKQDELFKITPHGLMTMALFVPCESIYGMPADANNCYGLATSGA